MIDSQAGWNELYEALKEEPTSLAFRAVCSILDTWTGSDLEEAIHFAADQLALWQNHLRRAPWTWGCALLEGHSKPTWKLVRSIAAQADTVFHFGYPGLELAQLAARAESETWTDFHCFFLDDEVETFLAQKFEQLPSLERIYDLWSRETAAFQTLLESPVWKRIKTLEVRLRDEVPLVSPLDSASSLEKLTLTFPVEKDVTALFSARQAPALRELSIRGNWHPNPVPTPEPFLHLMDTIPVAQLESLELNEFSPDVLAVLCSRRAAHLNCLTLRNRPYYRQLVDTQQFARRLDRTTLDLIARSGFLHHIFQLVVEHERIGDDILTWVEAIPPNQLTSLELIDVGLTDDGAERLAALPQLANVASLKLDENQLTVQGVAALTRSPYLTHLRYLSIGSAFNNPYYGGSARPQPIGDEGAVVLAKSPLMKSLRTLELCYAEIGSEGASALGGAEAGDNLRTLNLACNPIGSVGVKELIKGSWIERLKDLSLAMCALDDVAVGYLAQIQFQNLRSLDLGYNSIGDEGAQQLAAAAGLAWLWRLSLHDNVFGDAGLLALVRSSHFNHLVEFDIEQDVWNIHRHQFSDEVAAALAASPTMARLDTLFCGVVDEYHGERYKNPFRIEGMSLIYASKQLRPEVRFGLARAAANLEKDIRPELEAWEVAYLASEDIREDIRQRDFRSRWKAK